MVDHSEVAAEAANVERQPRLRLGRQATASVHIDAAPAAVWAVVADVTRGGEWSGESLGGSWLGDATTPAPGARFRGQNRRRGVRWSRTNEVLTATPNQELTWRTVPALLYRDSTEWRLHLQPDGDGTRVTESYQLLWINRACETLFALTMPEHRDRSQDLTDDLHRLKGVVESEPRSHH